MIYLDKKIERKSFKCIFLHLSVKIMIDALKVLHRVFDIISVQ